MKKNIWK